jgi:phosphate acetyltransferase
VLFGAEFLNNEIGNYSVGAMQLRNYLLHLKEKAITLVIVLILFWVHCKLMNLQNYPAISGIVLTGNIVPDDSILLLIEGLTSIVLLFLSKAVPIILLIKLGI